MEMYSITRVISWWPEFLLSLQVEIMSNTPKHDVMLGVLVLF